MKTKYIVIFIVIIAIGSGGYLFQKRNEKKELLIHKKQQLIRMTEVANRSSSAGLQTMAIAINQFHKTNGQYPKNLLKLYPEFIPERSFILKVKWVYQLEKNDYRLYKNLKGNQMVASIGPDLAISRGTESTSTSKTMVASVDKTITQQQKSKKVATYTSSPTKSDTKPYIKLDRKDKQIVKLRPLALVKTSLDIKTKKNMELTGSKYSSKIVTKKLNKDEKYLLSLNNNELYIWKSKDGYVGFSNVKYPDRKNIAVYKDASWIKYLD